MWDRVSRRRAAPAMAVLICIKAKRLVGSDTSTMYFRSPACPSCVREMVCASGPEECAPGLSVYHCEKCGTAFSEVPSIRMTAPDRALVLNFEANTARH
jgi:DNA-directed RNA polymerase subunit RPC12/RpoP